MKYLKIVLILILLTCNTGNTVKQSTNGYQAGGASLAMVIPESMNPFAFEISSNGIWVFDANNPEDYINTYLDNSTKKIFNYSLSKGDRLKDRITFRFANTPHQENPHWLASAQCGNSSGTYLITFYPSFKNANHLTRASTVVHELYHVFQLYNFGCNLDWQKMHRFTAIAECEFLKEVYYTYSPKLCFEKKPVIAQWGYNTNGTIIYAAYPSRLVK